MVDVTLKDRRREKKRLAQKAQQSHRCRRTCSEAKMAMDSPCRHVEWHDMEEAYTVEECAKKKKMKKTTHFECTQFDLLQLYS